MIDSRCRTGLFSLLIGLGYAASPGCGDGKPGVDTSLTEATVNGVVSIKGVPATGGSILFNPSNSGRLVATRSASIGPDGKYTIKTLTGGNQVTFDGDIAIKNKGVGMLKEYVEVQSGTNTADFDLMGPNGGKKPNIPFEAGGVKKSGPKQRTAK
jgi:hypothetical protein